MLSQVEASPLESNRHYMSQQYLVLSVEKTLIQGNIAAIISVMILFTLPSFADSWQKEVDSVLHSMRSMPPGKRAALLNKKGWEYRKSDINKSRIYILSALAEGEKAGDYDAVSSSQSFLGVLERNTGNFSGAMEWYYQAMRTALDHNIPRNLAYSYNNIAEVYGRFNDFTIAQEYYQKAEEIFRRENDTSGLAYVHLRLGESFQQIEELDSALFHFRHSLGLRNAIGDTVNSPVNDLAIARVLFLQGKLDEVLEIVNKHASNFESSASKFLDDVNLLRARVLLSLGKVDSALVVARNAINNANVLGIATMEQEGYAIMSEAALLKKDTILAFVCLQKLKELDVLVNSENQARVIGAQEALFALRKKEDELTIISEQRKAEQLFFSIMLGAALVLSLLIIGLAFVLRKVKKQQKSIEEKNKELYLANERLAELGRFRDIMTGTIVHDLKNPLNVIINLSSYEHDRNLQSIHQAGRQMLTLVLNILDVQKFEDAEMQINTQTIAIEKLFRNTLAQVDVFIKEKNLKFRISAPENIAVSCDIEMIERVIVNLLTNAIKYSHMGGNIEMIATPTAANTIEIAVLDSGDGIPAGKESLIFEKFQQVEQRSLGQNRSTGLGLTFCKMAVEAHGQSIRAENRKDGEKGAAFYFSLPIATKQIAQSEDPSATASPENVVVIEQAAGLHPQDKELLAPLYEQLKVLEVYQFSDVMEVLDTIQYDNVSLLQWRKHIENSVIEADDATFKRQLEMIRP